MFVLLNFLHEHFRSESWISESSRSVAVKVSIRARRARHDNFTFLLSVECALSLSLFLRLSLSKRVDAKCPGLLLTCTCACSYLSIHLHIYGVSQIKRSFAKRPSRPASSELIIATSAYQRPRDSPVDRDAPFLHILAKLTQRLRSISSVFKER